MHNQNTGASISATMQMATAHEAAQNFHVQSTRVQYVSQGKIFISYLLCCDFLGYLKFGGYDEQMKMKEIVCSATPAATPCRAGNQQGLAALLPSCPSARKAENDHKSPGGYSDDITGHLSRLSFNSELVGLPSSAGCLVARCIAAQRAGGFATFSWVPCVLCPLWGLVVVNGHVEGLQEWGCHYYYTTTTQWAYCPLHLVDSEGCRSRAEANMIMIVSVVH